MSELVQVVQVLGVVFVVVLGAIYFVTPRTPPGSDGTHN